MIGATETPADPVHSGLEGEDDGNTGAIVAEGVDALIAEARAVLNDLGSPWASSTPITTRMPPVLPALEEAGPMLAQYRFNHCLDCVGDRTILLKSLLNSW